MNIIKIFRHSPDTIAAAIELTSGQKQYFSFSPTDLPANNNLSRIREVRIWSPMDQCWKPAIKRILHRDITSKLESICAEVIAQAPDVVF